MKTSTIAEPRSAWTGLRGVIPLLALVAGCAGAPPPIEGAAPGATSGGSGSADDLVDSTPRALAAGAWEHPTSGAVFPPAYGSFVRSSLRCYDQEHTDCGANYDDEGARLSIFVYPVGPNRRGSADPGRDEFHDALAEIGKHSPLDEGGDVTILTAKHAGGDSLIGPAFTGTVRVIVAQGDMAELAMKLATSGGGVILFDADTNTAYLQAPKTTQLFVTVRDGWYVKVRLTHGSSLETGRALDVLRAFLADVPLPTRLAPKDERPKAVALAL
jgi:hypothetical protein